MKTLTERLMELLGGAKPSDVEDLDKQITLAETELGFLRTLRARVQVRSIETPVMVADEPSPAKIVRKTAATKAPKAAPTGSRADLRNERQLRVAKMLVNGPLRTLAIAHEIGIPTGSITGVLRHEWFEKTPDGKFTLSLAGIDAIEAGEGVKVASPAPAPTKDSPPAELVRRLGPFLKANGPRRRDGIKRFLECSDDMLEKVLGHSWFDKDNGMFTLSSDGHAEFGRQNENEG